MLMVPQLTMNARRIVTDVKVFVKLLNACRLSIWPLNEAGISQIDKLTKVAGTQKWVVDQHPVNSSMKVGLGALALFIYWCAAQEPIDAIVFRHCVRAVGGQ